MFEYDEKTNNYLPTDNAILLFGKRPRNKFPQAAVKAKVDFGNDDSETKTFDDPLTLIPDEVEDWVRKVLLASFDRSKFKAKQVPAFPIEVIREALINAIDKLNEVELASYDFVRSRKEVSKKEYDDHFDLSDKVAQNQLRKMQDLDLIGDNGELPKSNKYKYVYKE